MEDEIVPGCNRQLHVRRRRRNLFGKARKAVFLEHLAATCNVQASAAVAGVAVQTVYNHRMKDAEFRAGWNAAIEQGYARLEAALLARAAAGEGRLEIGGDKIVDGAEAPERIDWDKGMELLRNRQRNLGGRSVDNRMRPVRVPIEVVAGTLIRKMRALGVTLPEGDA